MANAAPLITQTSHEHSGETKDLFAALLKAKQAFPDIPKTGYNPYFESNFSSLKDVKEATDGPLAEEGLVITQFPGQTVQGDPALTTWLVHTPTGQYLADTAALALGKKDPQALGSAITYVRRYARKAILDLLDEENDDDANGATLPDSKVNPNRLESTRAEFKSVAKRAGFSREDTEAFWKEKGYKSTFEDTDSLADLTEAVTLIKALKSGAKQ